MRPARDKRHFHLRNLGIGQNFRTPRSGGQQIKHSPVDRNAHAEMLLSQIKALSDLSASDAPDGLYLSIIGREGQTLDKAKLNSSDLKLLSYKPHATESPCDTAIVYATEKAIEKLSKKITDFGGENTDRGIPKNQPLVQPIGQIAEAELRNLWRGNLAKFPADNTPHYWEIWLDKDQADKFTRQAQTYDIQCGRERIKFPETVIILARATPEALWHCARQIGIVQALAYPATTAEFFTSDLQIEEQAEWVNEL